MHFVYSAPGKAILFGEHSVVYGHPAIASSIGLRARCSVERLDGACSGAPLLRIDRPDVGSSLSWDRSAVEEAVESFVSAYTAEVHENGLCSVVGETIVAIARQLGDRAIGRSNDDSDTGLIATLFLYLAARVIYDAPRSSSFDAARQRRRAQRCCPALRLELSSEIPLGAGLGSSAAYLVCIAGSFLHQFHDEFEGATAQRLRQIAEGEEFLSTVNQWAFEAETLVHGKGASGVDNTVATYGGVIRYCKASEPKMRQLSGHAIQEILKLQFLVVDSGTAGNTQKLVEGVRRLRDNFPDVLDSVLSSLGILATRAERVLEECEGDEVGSRIGDLMELCHGLLNTIGVGHDVLEHARSTGKRLLPEMSFKLTGAGGGGCALCLLHSSPAPAELQPILEEWSAQMHTAHVQRSCRVFSTSLAGKGFTFHPQT